MEKGSEQKLLSHEDIDMHARECLGELELFFRIKEDSEKIDVQYSHLYRISVLFRVIQYIICDSPDENIFVLINPDAQDISPEEAYEKIKEVSREVAQDGFEIMKKGVPWFVELMGYLSEVFRDLYNSGEHSTDSTDNTH